MSESESIQNRQEKILILYKFKLWFLNINDDFIQDRIIGFLQEWGQSNKNFQSENHFWMFVNNGSLIKDPKHYAWSSLHNCHSNNSFKELSDYLKFLMNTLTY